MSFCAAINCLDSARSSPSSSSSCSDSTSNTSICSPTPPLGILARDFDAPRAQAFVERVRIVIRVHDVTQLAICGHWDCRGNPVPKETQLEQQQEVARRFRALFPQLTIIGLWVDEASCVHEIDV